MTTTTTFPTPKGPTQSARETAAYAHLNALAEARGLFGVTAVTDAEIEATAAHYDVDVTMLARCTGRDGIGDDARRVAALASLLGDA